MNSVMSLTIGLLPILLAQEATEAPTADTGSGGGIVGGLIQIVFYAIAYVFAAYTCQKIFERCGVPNPWYAWIPILGTYANFQAGDEENPTLWTVLALVPCVNIVAIVKLVQAWIVICGKLGKSPWLLLLALVPLGSFVLLGYLAFT